MYIFLQNLSIMNVLDLFFIARYFYDFAIDLPEACELWAHTWICCTQRVGVVTLKEVNPATLIYFNTGKRFVCTCIREWRNFKSISCLSSILASLQSSHVDGDYIYFCHDMDSLFFLFLLNKFWHGKEVNTSVNEPCFSLLRDSQPM